MDTLQSITPRQLDERRHNAQAVRLIDVRSPAEFREAPADVALNVPLNQLDPGTVPVLCPETEPLYVMSRQGLRARQACERLRAAGCANVVNVEGGAEGWMNAGLPVVRATG